MYLFHLAAQSYPLHLPPSIDLPFHIYHHHHTFTHFFSSIIHLFLLRRRLLKEERKERKTMFVDKLEDLNVNGF
jgi:hypothetical protein